MYKKSLRLKTLKHFLIKNRGISFHPTDLLDSNNLSYLQHRYLLFVGWNWNQYNRQAFSDSETNKTLGGLSAKIFANIPEVVIPDVIHNWCGWQDFICVTYSFNYWVIGFLVRLFLYNLPSVFGFDIRIFLNLNF